MNNQDEILLELVNSLRSQNEDLKKQLEKNPRSLLGISEMWSAFWSTIGGIWKDFWSSVSEMWKTVWTNDDAVVGVSVSSVIIVIALCVTYGVTRPSDPSEPAPIPLKSFSLMSGNNNCYFVVQDLSTGGHRQVSPCIQDRDAALSLMNEMVVSKKEQKKTNAK